MTEKKKKNKESRLYWLIRFNGGLVRNTSFTGEMNKLNRVRAELFRKKLAKKEAQS